MRDRQEAEAIDLLTRRGYHVITPAEQRATGCPYCGRALAWETGDLIHLAGDLDAGGKGTARSGSLAHPPTRL